MKNFIAFIIFIIFLHPYLFAQGFDELADAIYEKDSSKIADLLDSGIDVNISPEGYQTTVLFIACSMEGYENIASLLISRGADVNYKGKDGRTPIMWAAGNSLETTKLLFEHGADIKATADDGMTALIESIFGILSKKVTFDVLAFLLNHGANINDVLTGKGASGWTALLFATVNGNKDLVEYLIKHGANVNHTSDEGSTALSLAKQEKYKEIVELLKKAGAKE